MNPLIHIGYPKTASTWFRNQFYSKLSNVNYLDREEVKKLIIEPYIFKSSTVDGRLKKVTFIKSRVLFCNCIFIIILSLVIFCGLDMTSPMKSHALNDTNKIKDKTNYYRLYLILKKK